MLTFKKSPKLSKNNICLDGISYLYPICTIKKETVLYLGSLFKNWYKENNNTDVFTVMYKFLLTYRYL